MHSYPSLLDGARGLLAECVRILTDLPGTKYVVVGGWSPLLRNVGPLPHPGTRDVDLLFEDGAVEGELKTVVQSFLRAGFLLSAKHEFQLLRVLQVAGTEFVFNVDLLHPSEAEVKPDLFVDHLELPVPLSEYRGESFTTKSIVMPEAAFLFDGHTELFELSACLPDGSEVSVEVPLMDEVGVLVTKSASLANPKRVRDAYDVYLAIAQARDFSRLVEQFKRLKVNNEAAYNTLYGILHAADSGSFGKSVASYASVLIDHEGVSPDDVDRRMREFFTAIELQPRAENPDRRSRLGAGE